MSDLRITDEAVEAAADAYLLVKPTDRVGWRLDKMRIALEAALPLLAPQPVVDREAIAKAIHDANFPLCSREHALYADGPSGDQADAVLALLNGAAS